MKTLISKEDKICGISNGFISIEECPSKEADEIVKKYHYSKKTTKNRFKSFKVNGSVENGVLQLGYGIRPNEKHTISKLITKENYCEFDRMWLCDELPKNSESQVISLLLSYLKQVYPNIKFVITYADESVGNKGTIYKATNAMYLGGVNVDFYILPSGERVHPVTMWHRHKTRKREFLEKTYAGYKHIKGEFKQNRFLYILDRKFLKEYNKEKNINLTLI